MKIALVVALVLAGTVQAQAQQLYIPLPHERACGREFLRADPNWDHLATTSAGSSVYNLYSVVSYRYAFQGGNGYAVLTWWEKYNGYFLFVYVRQLDDTRDFIVRSSATPWPVEGQGRGDYINLVPKEDFVPCPRSLQLVVEKADDKDAATIINRLLEAVENSAGKLTIVEPPIAERSWGAIKQGEAAKRLGRP